MEEILENQDQQNTEGGENLDGLRLNSSEENNEENNSKEEKQHVEEEQAPENYDYSNVELPEGMELDKELTEEFSTAAKELNLSQAKADKFMSMGVKLTQKLNDKFQSALKEAQEEQIKAYATMLNTDDEIGGAKLNQALRDANVAYDTFVSKEAADVLAETGLNKHPAIVKVFMKIGKELKNDAIRQTGDTRKERTADDWYPNM